MDVVQCPICEFVVPIPDPPDHAGILALLVEGAPSMTPEQAQSVEKALYEHMGTHSIKDWVVAFKQADAYIEQLEGELEDARQAAVTTLAAPWKGPVRESVDDLADLDPPRGALRYPNGRPQVNPDESLIPVIPTSQRPEGMVGRKT